MVVDVEQLAAPFGRRQIAGARQLQHRLGALMLAPELHQRVGAAHEQRNTQRIVVGHSRVQRLFQCILQRRQVVQRLLVLRLPARVGHQRHQLRGQLVARRLCAGLSGAGAVIGQPAPGVGVGRGWPVRPARRQPPVQLGPVRQRCVEIAAQHVVQPQRGALAVVVQQGKRLQLAGRQIAGPVVVQPGGELPELRRLDQRDRHVLRKDGQLGAAAALVSRQQIEAGLHGAGNRLVALAAGVARIEGDHPLARQVVGGVVQRLGRRDALLVDAIDQRAVYQAQQHRPVAETSRQRVDPCAVLGRQTGAQQRAGVLHAHAAQLQQLRAGRQQERVTGRDQARAAGAGLQQVAHMGRVPDVVHHQQHLATGQRSPQLVARPVDGRAAVAAAG